MADEPDLEPAAEGPAAAARLAELGNYIREQRSRAQYSMRHLARIAGVSNPYLSQIERGLRKPSAEILHAIAKALQISSETLYVKAGILDDRDVPDPEAAILRDARLSQSQRDALVGIYRAFRSENEAGGAAGATDDSRGAAAVEGAGRRGRRDGG